MKKVYKMRDEENAVSPVIATILMVAITVVLAAVLYVMVIGMSEGSGDTAPVGTMASMSATSSTNATLTFSTFAPVPAPMDVKIILTPSDTTEKTAELTFSTAPTATNPDMTVTGLDVTIVGYGATYSDLNYGGNTINSGVYINVVRLTPGLTYTLSIYHYPSDSVCSMTGSLTFQTPP